MFQLCAQDSAPFNRFRVRQFSDLGLFETPAYDFVFHLQYAKGVWRSDCFILLFLNVDLLLQA